MGVVYAARDRELDRRVALKVVDLAFAGEAQLIALLEHPAVVPIYETGMLPDGRVFYAMKFVGGARLDTQIAELPSLAKGLGVIRRIGEALALKPVSQGGADETTRCRDRGQAPLTGSLLAVTSDISG